MKIISLIELLLSFLQITVCFPGKDNSITNEWMDVNKNKWNLRFAVFESTSLLELS